jgi:hypothetical protein
VLEIVKREAVEASVYAVCFRGQGRMRGLLGSQDPRIVPGGSARVL